jgi:prevent-host-death family protein
MRRVAAESFKTNGLGLFDEVQAEHETVAITKHGRPIAKLIPLNTETDEIYNFLKAKEPSREMSFHPRFQRSRELESALSPEKISVSLSRFWQTR